MSKRIKSIAMGICLVVAQSMPVYAETQQASGWKETNGSLYHFNTKGEMSKELAKIDGDTYYFGADGAMRTGWCKIEDSWYRFEQHGKMQTGWCKIEDNWYYFNEQSGVMEHDKIVDGYKLGSDGAWIY